MSLTNISYIEIDNAKYKIKDAEALGKNDTAKNAEKVNGYSVYTDVPEDAKFTDENTTYTFSEENHVLTITGTDGTDEHFELGGKDPSVELTQVEYDALGEKTKTDGITYYIKDAEKSGVSSVLSHVGMIIHTTTLNTEAKVKAIYGGNTWAKIEGKFLFGSDNSHAVNATGGAKKHTHELDAVAAVRISATALNVQGKNNPTGYQLTRGIDNLVTTAKSETVTEGSAVFGTATSSAENSMPPYKAVYIWERTS